MNGQRIHGTLCLVLLTLVVSACSGVLTSEQSAKQFYALMPVDGPGEGDGPVLALTVSAVPGLDTDRIQGLGSDAQFKRYANARWPDNLPEVLESVLKRSLENSGEFSEVLQSDRVVEGGWRLTLEAREFYGTMSADDRTNSVRVKLAGIMECGSERRSLSLSASKSVMTEGLTAVVAAHQAALDDVTRQLLSRIATLCN